MIVPIYNNSENPNPKYSNSTDAGCDLRADFSRVSPENMIKIYGDGAFLFPGEGHKLGMLRLDPMARAIIPTGIFTAIPEGYEVQIRPRSGMAIKKGLTVINTPGTIDAGYRNEWGVPVINLGFETVWIEDGERIAQAVLNKFEKIEWENYSLPDITSMGNNRGGGFGHSNYDKNGKYIK
jgi:dUTP pyrophosphatase